MRIRTTNKRLIDFAYTPGSAEQAELMSSGKSAEQAADRQYFHVTPDGVDVPDRVGDYAVGLYSAQMEAMGNEARVADETIGTEAKAVLEAGAATVGDSTGVEISGEDAPPDVASFPSLEEEVSVPKTLCLKCTPVVEFEAKTPAAAKGKLTRHTKLEHGG